MGLRTWQLLAGRSMHMDEAALLAGIERPWSALAQPLPYAQTAPLGWLAATKATASVFGTSELALRLLPFLAGLAALLLFAELARRRLPPLPGLFALALFTLSGPLILYGAFLKPYSADVLASVLVLYALERWRPVPLAALALLPWFSEASVIVLAAAGVWLLFARRRAALPIVAAWTAGGLPVVALALAFHDGVAGAYMRDFWVAGFPPRNRDLALWPFWRALVLDYGVLGLHWLGLAASVPLGVAGAVGLWRRDRDAFRLYTLVGLAALTLAALRLYPLGGTFELTGGRTALWLAPFLALLLGAGAQALGHRFVWLPAGAVAASCAVLRGTPFHMEEVRPAAEYVAANERPGDAVYVYYGARHPWRYYAPRYRLSGVVLGGCHRSKPGGYVAEVRQFRGRSRVWVVASHDYIGEIDWMGRVLHAAGREVLTRRWPGTTATLYDLSAWREPALPPWTAAPQRWSVRECVGVWDYGA